MIYRPSASAFRPLLQHLAVAAFLTVFLSACAANLVTPYDEVIDKGVSEFNEKFREFTAKLNRTAGTPEGTYDPNIQFYETWNAKIAAYADRAAARRPGGTCLGADTLGGLLQEGVGELLTSVQAQRLDPSPPPEGSCSAQLLQLLGLQLYDFASFHKAQGPIGIPAKAKAPITLMTTVITAILRVELAKQELASQ